MSLKKAFNFLRRFPQTRSTDVLTPGQLRSRGLAVGRSYWPRMTSTVSDNSETPSRSAHFFFPDGTVVFSVQGKLYKVHRHFFESHSSVFKSMFSLPTAPGELPEGQSEETPIVLEGLECHEFECFLLVLYPSDFSKANNTTTKDWTSVLSLASKWEFTSIRQLAIDQLSEIASPVEKITICLKYDVKDFLETAYTELCTRYKPLNLEEGTKLGMRDTIFIGEVRNLSRESRSSCDNIIAEKLKAHLSTL